MEQAGPGAEAPARDHRAHERQVPRSPCAADRLKEHSHDARLDRALDSVRR
ncbi:MAG: hypothetical protein E6K45_01430, partial [Gammaproteobacteria bacterium]